MKGNQAKDQTRYNHTHGCRDAHPGEDVDNTSGVAGSSTNALRCQKPGPMILSPRSRMPRGKFSQRHGTTANGDEDREDAIDDSGRAARDDAYVHRGRHSGPAVADIVSSRDDVEGFESARRRIATENS